MEPFPQRNARSFASPAPMRRHKHKLTWAGAVGLSALLICSTLTDIMAGTGSKTVVLGIFGGVALLLTIGLILWDIQFGLIAFLPISCLSPRLGANFRLSDLIVPFLLVVWIGRALSGEKTIVRTPLTVPALVVTLTMLLSSLWGLGIGTVHDLLLAVMILGKRLEYFLLFFLALNIIRSREGARRLLGVFFLASIMVVAISMAGSGIDYEVGSRRATGLDESNYNTYAGFLTIGITLAVAGAIQARSFRLRSALTLTALVLMIGLLKSYSREGYFILAAALLSLGVLRYRFLLPLLAVFALAAPYILPATVIDRAKDAVEQVQNYQTDDIGSNSVSARMLSWRWRWNEWIVKHPWIGNGVGSVDFSIDNEYFLRLAEGGVVGLAAFLWLLISCGRYLLDCARRLRGTEGEPYAYGLLAVFIALLAQGFAAVSWNTIRTMEPFWVLAGMLGGLLFAPETVSATPAAHNIVEAGPAYHGS